MNNFTFYNPVKIIFGENTIPTIGKEIPADAKVLITFGGGSIKQNGIYDQVKNALSKHTVIEFGGIEPNPQYSTLTKAVEICRNEKIGFILAVGGGSVLDGSKFIAAATHFEGEPWDILDKQAKIKKAVPLGSVLTLPATGSEMNAFAVISRKELKKKLGFGSPFCFPKFSVLDPNVTRTLSTRQRANGIIDAFIHVTEQYMTYPVNSPVQDYFAESIMKVLIEEGPKYYNHVDDMDAAKNVMWAATMALNGIISAGVPMDWATHSIGHELTVLYNTDHARTLSIVWPGMMKVMAFTKKEKLVQFAERVWGINGISDSEKINKAITNTEMFFKKFGVATRLCDFQVEEFVVDKVLNNLRENGFTALGERKLVTLDKVKEILEDRIS